MNKQKKIIGREIEFRGKRVDNGEWVFGYCLTSLDIGEHICHLIRQVGTGGGYNDWIVSPETVGQYTGRKDKKGKKLFDGDFIDVEGIPALISWNHESALFIATEKTKYEDWRMGNCFSRYEKIGNKFDNPELLKIL